MSPALLPGPFHVRLAGLADDAGWTGAHGWLAPLRLRDADLEYAAIRNAAALIDRTHLVRYRIHGPGAEALLDRLTVGDVSAMEPGTVADTLWCDDRGHVIGLGTLARLSGDDFRLTTRERHLDWLSAAGEGFAAAVREETGELASLGVEGPTAAAILCGAGFDVSAVPPGGLVRIDAGDGFAVDLARTGSTGDLGYDLVVPAPAGLALWDRLMDAGRHYGLTPAGIEALTLAELETGLPAPGRDFAPADTAADDDGCRTPLELGLGHWVAIGKLRHFNGRQALARSPAGQATRLVGLEVEGADPPPAGAPVLGRWRRVVGRVTAAAWSPAGKRVIALAEVRRDAVENSSRLSVEFPLLRRRMPSVSLLEARLVERPFFAPVRRLATPPEPP